VPLLEPSRLVGFEQIRIGDVFRCKQTFGAAEMEQFAALSGDYSAIHTDAATAKSFGFPDRLQYGFLMASLLSRIVGENFENAVCAAVSIDFTRPALPGQCVEVAAEVSQVQPAMRSVVLKVVMTSEPGTVVRGKLTTVFLSTDSRK
jgi:3-hydroxybutyryl-CoA dehydratase